MAAAVGRLADAGPGRAGHLRAGLLNPVTGIACNSEGDPVVALDGH